MYIGSTKNKFKDRWYKHKESFETEDPKKSTTLSTYIWKLKHRGLKPEIEWSIIFKAYAFSSGSKQCNLCLKEKLCILKEDPQILLNKRDEILEKCRHKLDFSLYTCIKKSQKKKKGPT